MLAYKLGAVLAAKIIIVGIKSEARAVFVHHHAGNAPFITQTDPHANHSSLGAPRKLLRAVPFSVDRQETAGGQNLRKRPFLLQNPINRPEKFQMLATDAR